MPDTNTPKEDLKVIHPDLIIDSDPQEGKASDPQPTRQNAANDFIKNKGPFILRFFALLGVFCCLIFSIGVLVGLFILSIAALLSALRNPGVNAGVFTYLKLLKNTLIAGFGCLLGVLSPTLGVTFLTIYFSISDTKSFIRSIFSPSTR